MKQAGFKSLNLSLVSTSKDQLNRFNRPDVKEAFDTVLLSAEAFDLNAVGYIIAGAPFQSPKASVEDLLFLAGRRVLAGVSIFYPAPGSADYKLCKQLNLLPKSFSLMRSSALPISHETTRTDAVTLARLGRILNFMKHLLDCGQKLPEPVPYHSRSTLDLEDRTTMGKQLLQWFLYDGKVRGVTPDGEIFYHKISPHLTRHFIEGLKKITLRGYLR
jgi:hypothetical protein